MWKVQMTDILTSLNLMGHADGTDKEKPETVPTPPTPVEGQTAVQAQGTSEWKKADLEALMNIRLRCDYEPLGHI